MTVRELIIELLKFNLDLEVVKGYDDGQEEPDFYLEEKTKLIGKVEKGVTSVTSIERVVI